MLLLIMFFFWCAGQVLAQEPDVIISFTVPANRIEGVKNAFCKKFGYKPIVNGQPNPVSRLKFTKRKWARYGIDVAIAQDTKVGANAGRRAAKNKAEQEYDDITITSGGAE
jgi:hypothetical protein